MNFSPSDAWDRVLEGGSCLVDDRTQQGEKKGTYGNKKITKIGGGGVMISVHESRQACFG